MGNFNMSDFMNNVSKKDIRKGGRVENIDVRKLRPSSDEKNFYHISEESINKLAASIELLGGVQENLVVKPIDGTDEYEVIAGHTRRMASLKLLEEGKEQFSLVPCKVEDRNDSVRDELILIMTNSTQRVRTDAEKMVEAQRLRSLITEYRKEHDDLSGSTQEIIGNILGISKSKVGRLDNINRNLQPELKKEFESGKLNTSTANEIAGLPEDKQKELGEELQEKGSLSMKDVFAKKMIEKEDDYGTDQADTESDTLDETEEESFSEKIHMETPEATENGCTVDTSVENITEEHSDKKIDFFTFTRWYAERTGMLFIYEIRKILEHELDRFHLDVDFAFPMAERLYLKMSDVTKEYKAYVLEKIQEGESE